MFRHKAYKFRLYPTVEQEILIGKTIGSSRFIYNHMLTAWNSSYKKTGKGLSYGKCSAMLPAMKKSGDTSWLKEVD
ncbi:MAG: helix-turn-helix domain-containing protein, partial [Enterococcus italicus]